MCTTGRDGSGLLLARRSPGDAWGEEGDKVVVLSTLLRRRDPTLLIVFQCGMGEGQQILKD